jgi:hypothetical protein
VPNATNIDNLGDDYEQKKSSFWYLWSKKLRESW